jgi:hypothetical protein
VERIKKGIAFFTSASVAIFGAYYMKQSLKKRKEEERKKQAEIDIAIWRADSYLSEED